MANILLGLHDALQIVYFLLHVPITILFDSQSVIPESYYPSWAVDMLKWHIKTNKDFLVRQSQGHAQHPVPAAALSVYKLHPDA